MRILHEGMLLLKSLPTKHHEIYGPFNTVCQFIKHMKYDKAELVEIEAIIKPASSISDGQVTQLGHHPPQKHPHPSPRACCY